MLCTKKNHIFDRLKNTVQSTVFFSPQVRRHKGFPKENLGAGGIHFRRASEMKRAPEIRKIFGNCCVTRVFRRKTLAQAEFTSAEQVKRQTASQPHEKKIPLVGLAC